MGIIALFLFAGHLVFFTGPGLALAGFLIFKEKRDPFFWATTVLFLLAAAMIRIYLVFLPFLDAGKAPVWTVIGSLLISRALFYSYVPSVVFLIAGIVLSLLKKKHTLVDAAAAGIFLSFPAQLLAVFFTNALLRLMGLQASY